MTEALYRRGPDDQGLYIDSEGGCGLGHRRLSIVDLDGGHQPLATADGNIQAIVNGEIYNFHRLRAELEAYGHRFLTRSDSEVVVHGYRQWGTEVIARLEGMFALAVWDVSSRRLLLARDRMGQKPLYIAYTGSSSQPGLVFASEPKALFIHPEVSRTPSSLGLSQYLTYECLPENLCLTEGMEKLRPGEYILYDRETSRIHRETYWAMRFQGAPQREALGRFRSRDIVDGLKDRVLKSVRDRLLADVPLGVFLSGGLDSSLITAALAQVQPSPVIKTFSVTFEDPSFDESCYARRVAEHLGTEHHEQRLSPTAMIDVLPEVSRFMCEPSGDASIIPTYLLSRFTQQTVKVALGGDGGDELFLGYPTFVADRTARMLDRILSPELQAVVGWGVLGAASYLPVSRKNFSFDFKIKRFAQGLGFNPRDRHQAWMGSFLPDELRRIMASDVRSKVRAHPYELIDRLHMGSDPVFPFDEVTLQYARIYLAGDVLTKVDRASMACGLEVRAPLLDRPVVEYACALPSSWKLRGWTTKYILKELARKWLPASIVDRPKKGFGVPIADWIRGPLKELMCDLLSADRLRREGWLNPTEVERLVQAHLDGSADHRKPLWTLMAFQLWLDHHGPHASLH